MHVRFLVCIYRCGYMICSHVNFHVTGSCEKLFQSAQYPCYDLYLVLMCCHIFNFREVLPLDLAHVCCMYTRKHKNTFVPTLACARTITHSYICTYYAWVTHVYLHVHALNVTNARMCIVCITVHVIHRERIWIHNTHVRT